MTANVTETEETTRAFSASEIITRMPKAELHVHLDGCLPVQTVADLASEQGIDLPVPLPDLRAACVVPEDCLSLADYLDRFVIPLMVLQRPDALERAVYELCEGCSRRDVRYIEPRFAPSLLNKNGMSIGEAIAASTRGWHAGARDFGLEGGIILCATASPAAGTESRGGQGR